jgi:hypothetical protein
MGYDKLDELCINTIRTLAVRRAFDRAHRIETVGVEVEEKRMHIGAVYQDQWLMV